MEGHDNLLTKLILREIKNAVRVAQSCAALKNVCLSYELLTTVLEMATEFGDFVGVDK